MAVLEAARALPLPPSGVVDLAGPRARRFRGARRAARAAAPRARRRAHASALRVGAADARFARARLRHRGPDRSRGLRRRRLRLPAVEVTDVARRFGSVQALDGVDLAVERRASSSACSGPNGAGKTTLISILAGLTRADRGTARVLGHDVVTDFRAARRSLGVVPQELVFDPFFTVRETLEFQAGYFGLRKQRRMDRRDPAPPRPHVEGERQHALAVRRHEAARAGRPGARAQAAGDRARRADRGRRRRAAAEPVGSSSASSIATATRSSSRRTTSRKPRRCAAASRC